MERNGILTDLPMHLTPPTAISCGDRFLADPSGGVKSPPRGMKCIGRLTDDLFALTKGFGGKFSKAPGDVHYTSEGSDALAAQVSTSVAKALSH